MEKINKILTEAMGDCWHDWDGKTSWSLKDMCRCGAHPAAHLKPPNFLTWEGFGKLWEWGTDQEWWDTFMTDNGRYNDNFEMFINESLIDPEPFARSVANYLQTKP